MTSSEAIYRLIFVGEGDFRCSEETLYKEAAISYRAVKRGEVMLFYSKSRNQVIWILGAGDIIDSRRWRLPKHRPWNPLMLSEYAKEAGIKLRNIRDFESYLEKRLGARP